MLEQIDMSHVPGSHLQITGVSNFRYGTGYLDANGFVHFNPEANYNGTGAGFEYAMAAVNERGFYGRRRAGICSEPIEFPG